MMSVETYRCHLSIPRAVWIDLRAEAVARQVTISRVIVQRLEREVGGDAGRTARGGMVDDDDDGGKKRRVTIRLDNKLFERLSREAAGLGMTHAAVAREWLRRAAMTKGGKADTLHTMSAPDELETVMAPEGKSMVLDF